VRWRSKIEIAAKHKEQSQNQKEKKIKHQIYKVSAKMKTGTEAKGKELMQVRKRNFRQVRLHISQTGP